MDCFPLIVCLPRGGGSLEDSHYHENNALWAYSLDTGDLTRIFVAPRGAEVTSPYLNKIGDFGYITLVVQHPYEDNVGVYSTSSTGKAGHVGYIGPIPLAS